MPRPRSLSLIFAGLLAWGFYDDARAEQAKQRAPLALFTTLPLYWGETAGLSETIAGTAEPHWARTAIEQDFELRPLDVLTAESLAPFDLLLLAQPRALAPVENVALDDWVRGGGRVLLFADPLLTAESRFGLGDPRRPADVVLLSPILGQWGLELTFDESQPAGRVVTVAEAAIPVEMAGRFVPSGRALTECEFLGEGLAARCTIGKGQALILADAALLDREALDPAERGAALSRLTALAFDSN